jgi:hypothetical protein
LAFWSRFFSLGETEDVEIYVDFSHIFGLLSLGTAIAPTMSLRWVRKTIPDAR